MVGTHEEPLDNKTDAAPDAKSEDAPDAKADAAPAKEENPKSPEAVEKR